MDRRDFLRFGLAAGATALGLQQVTSGEEPPAQTPPVKPCPPPLHPEDVREGVAGRKWVMVVDLAKCDG